MERRCDTCKNMGAPDELCRWCMVNGKIGWTADTLMAKRALNYLYGTKNMDVASMYPKLEKPIYIGNGPALPINNEIVEYLKNDVEDTMEMFMVGGRSNGKTLRTLEEAAKKIGCRVVAESWFKSVNMPGIEKVIFSGPCTIVLWNDNTKTIVRAQEGELFDPEKGLAMAISKKALGNKGNYFDEFKKWLPGEEKEEPIKVAIDFDGAALKQACMIAGKNLGDVVNAVTELGKNTVSPVNKDDEWKRAIAEYLLGKCEKE